MSSNLTTNMGSVLGSRIGREIRGATANSQTSTDVSIANTRAGFQQKFGGMQMASFGRHQYALFGSWSNSSFTVGP